MGEQALDVRSGLAVLRRRWRRLAGAAAAGLVLGTAYVVLVPAPLTSTTLVLLPLPSGPSESAADVTTQITIVQSTAVLERAGRALAPPLSARAVEGRVEVSAPTIQLIRIDATADRGRDAQKLSQAVADAYIAVVRDAARSVTADTLTGLRTRQGDLERQMKALQTEIDTTSGRQRTANPESTDGRREAQLLAQLRAEQANVSLQLDKVKDDIATSESRGSGTGAGTAVIQPATIAARTSFAGRLLRWPPLGTVLGAVLAAVAVLAQDRRDPRVWTRDDLADAVGSPVLAAVRGRPQRSLAEWSALLQNHQASAVESWSFRQVLRAVVPTQARATARAGPPRPAGRLVHPRALTVICLSGDERGLSVGVQLAAFTASLGVLTRVLPVRADDSAAALWGALAEGGAANRPALLPAARPAQVDDDAEAGDDAQVEVELEVTLMVVDRLRPALTDVVPAAATLLAVAPGTATREELARLAVAVDGAGHRIDGVLIADPDPGDRTTGWRTAGERSRQASLPVRLTGLGGAPPSPGAADDRPAERERRR